MNALDKSLEALCATHGLMSIGVTHHEGGHYSVSLQWPGGTSGGDRGCAIGMGDTTGQAFRQALAMMSKERALSPDGELVA